MAKYSHPYKENPGSAPGGAQDFADQLRSRLPHADVRVFFEEG